MNTETLIAQIIISTSLGITFVISYFIGRQRKRANKLEKQNTELEKQNAELEKHNQVLIDAVNKRPEPGTLSAAIKQSSPEQMETKWQGLRAAQGQPVLPVDKQRVIDYLKSEEIVFDLDADGDIALMGNGFVYRVLFSHDNGGIFLVRGDLGVAIPQDRRIELEMHVSKVHRDRYWPRLVIWETSEGELNLTADFGIIMRAGATDKQLSVRVSQAFVVIDAALTETLEALNIPKFGALD